ncbi:MAG: hypothetical protein WA874_06775 [Chryseosolibacter sp.]
MDPERSSPERFENFRGLSDSSGLPPGLEVRRAEKDDFDSAEPVRSSPDLFENFFGPSDSLKGLPPGLEVRFDEKDDLASEEPVRSSPDLLEYFLGLSLPDPARPPREEDEPLRSDRPLSLRLGIGLL